MAVDQPATEQFLIEHGADPSIAAAYAAQGRALSPQGNSAERAAVLTSLNNLPPAAKPAPPAAMSLADATAALRAHEESQFGEHIAQVYQRPPNAYNYRMPPMAGEVSAEAMASDRALLEMLHNANTDERIGNALLQDLHSGRPNAKSAETVAALTPWVQQMLTQALANPATKDVAAGLSAQLLIDHLSPETALAMLPFVKQRAGQR